jgi:hypothetical protein
MKDYVETPAKTPAGYQPGEYGPFKCDNCEYYTSGNKNTGDCSKPQVVEELGHELADSTIVEAEGCCNFFESKNKMPLRKNERMKP